MDIERLSRCGSAVKHSTTAAWAATAFMVARLMVGTLALSTRRIAETRHVRWNALHPFRNDRLAAIGSAWHGVVVETSMDTSWRDRLRCELPYGQWTMWDGREVLFNKHLHPIWERSGPGQPARVADPDMPVIYVHERHFYGHHSLPWRDRGSLRGCQAVLDEWGVLAPSMRIG